MRLAKKVFFIALMIWMIFTIDSYAVTGTITADGVRIRKEASIDSDVITITHENETVEVIEKSGDWYKIKYNDLTGFIRQDLLNVTENAQETEKQEETNNNEQTEAVATEPITENESKNKSSEKQVNKSCLLRIVPNLASSSIEKLDEGTKVTIIKELNSWTLISVRENIIGWVPTAFLTEIVEETSSKPIEEPKVTTKTGYVNVTAAIIRKGPSTSSEIISEWGRNKPVEIVGEDGDWYKIIFNGQEAYIAKRLVSDTQVAEASRSSQNARTTTTNTNAEQTKKVSEPRAEEKTKTETAVVQETNDAVSTAKATSTGEKVVELAKKYLGSSYTYGGSGPSSFDCSGFTMYIFKQFGVSLSHSATAQASNGTFVAKSNLQLGDIVIFRNYENTSIGHVGIYIGNNTFIHAANSRRGVTTDSLSSSYYSARYVTARRLV